MSQLIDDPVGLFAAAAWSDVAGRLMRRDILGDSEIKEQVAAAVGDPTWSGRMLLAISIVTLAARFRSIRKQS